MITVWKDGEHYAAIEGRSMIIGSAALCVYSVIVFRLLKRHQLSALSSSLAAMTGWFAVALGLDWLLFGS